LPILARRY